MGTFEEIPITPLGKKVVKSGVWVFSAHIVQQIFSFTRTLILARFLSPNDFGLFGIALLTLSTLDTFSQTGFKQALIQKNGDATPYFDTAWTIGVIRGFLIVATLFFIAPYAALFFKASQAEPILKVIGLAIILQSLTNVAVIYFEKELEFNKYFAYQVIGSIADLTVAILAVFLLRSVWALVFGRLAGNFTRCVISYIIDSYRPRFQLDFSKARELFGFGKWVLGSSILIFLITHGDDIFVGRLLGATALGFYQVAYLISNLPATEITHIISRVTFPAYSKLQDNISKLREAYLKVLQFTAFLTFPIAGLIFVLAPDFTKIFLGEKWMPMVPAMVILAICGVIISIGATTGPVFEGVGKPYILTRLVSVKLMVMLILIYPLTKTFGIIGTSFALLVSSLISNPLADYQVIKLISCRLWQFLRLVILPFLSSLIMLYSLMATRLFFPIKSLLFLIFYILLGLIIYLAIIVLFGKLVGYRIEGEIIKVFNTGKQGRLLD